VRDIARSLLSSASEAGSTLYEDLNKLMQVKAVLEMLDDN
jgi:hypothetical protein